MQISIGFEEEGLLQGDDTHGKADLSVAPGATLLALIRADVPNPKPRSLLAILELVKKRTLIVLW